MSQEDVEFQKVVMEGLVPKVADSAVCVSIVPRNEKNWVDAKFCIELGVMIMLDKPILAIAHPDAPVPEKLRLVADRVVVADLETSEGQRAIAEAIRDFQETAL